MADRDTDILVSGGGIAGLIAAAAFGATGARVICVDPAAPVTDEGAEGADLRTTAFLQPSADLLARIGLWDRLAPFATPLQVMKIVDAGGVEPTARLTRAFDAADIHYLRRLIEYKEEDFDLMFNLTTSNSRRGFIFNAKQTARKDVIAKMFPWRVAKVIND